MLSFFSVQHGHLTYRRRSSDSRQSVSNLWVTEHGGRDFVPNLSLSFVLEGPLLEAIMVQIDIQET